MSSWDDWFRRGRRWSVFDEMDRMFEDMFRETFEAMPKEWYRERKLPDGSIVKTFGPVVYGYSMTMGPDGKPVIREFGNFKPSRVRGLPTRGEQREPLVDVITGDELVQVTAEVPGVDKQDIDLTVAENSLIISVDTEKYKYHKEVPLPERIDPESASATYKNGVLEVSLRKLAKKKPTGKRISVE